MPRRVPAFHDVAVPAEKINKLRIVITQRADLAASLVAMLRKRGAHPLQVPVTRWTPPPNPARFDKILARAKARAYDWILFSNQHTVHFFFKRYRELFGDLRSLSDVRLAAYGPMTGRAMRAMRIKPAAIAADHKTPLILEAIVKAGAAKPPLGVSKKRAGAVARACVAPNKRALKGRRFLVIRGDARHAAENVPQALKQLGARVEVLQGYATETDTRDLTGDAADMLKNGADWLIFASAMAIQHFDRRFDTRKLLRRFPGIRLAVTNKTLCQALKKTGIATPPSVIARPNNAGDLLKIGRSRRDPTCACVGLRSAGCQPADEAKPRPIQN